MFPPTFCHVCICTCAGKFQKTTEDDFRMFSTFHSVTWKTETFVPSYFRLYSYNLPYEDMKVTVFLWQAKTKGRKHAKIHICCIFNLSSSTGKMKTQQIEGENTTHKMFCALAIHQLCGTLMCVFAPPGRATNKTNCHFVVFLLCHVLCQVKTQISHHIG